MFPRHATDVISLVFGAIFAGFTVVWLLTVTETIGPDDARLAGPVALIAAGAIGLVAALRPTRSGNRGHVVVNDGDHDAQSGEEYAEESPQGPDEGRPSRG